MEANKSKVLEALVRLVILESGYCKPAGAGINFDPCDVSGKVGYKDFYGLIMPLGAQDLHMLLNGQMLRQIVYFSVFLYMNES